MKLSIKSPASLILFLSAYSALLLAQDVSRRQQLSSTQPNSAQGPASSSATKLPIVSLEFKPRPVIPGTSASPVISMPILCAPDEVPSISVPEPPTYTNQTIYLLEEDGAHSFRVENIPDLYDVHFLSFFPGESSISILVTATKDSTKSALAIESPDGTIKNGTGFRGEHHEFIAKFDRSGNFKSTIPLPTRYSFHRFAELPDASLLAVAFDRLNNYPLLLLLDSSGQIIRSLEVPNELRGSIGTEEEHSSDGSNLAMAEASLSWWLFAPARNRVLLYRAHSTSPVLEFGTGGAVREVPIECPDGLVIDGFVPANDRWIVRFRRKRPEGRMGIDRGAETESYSLYEVDAVNGRLKREFESTSGPGFGVACEKDGVITGFSVSPDAKYVPLAADIPR